MKAARTALDAKKFDDASKSVAAALQAMPNDKSALALQQQIDNSKKAAADSTRMEADKKREFDRLIQQARTAMTATKFDDAIKAYTAALALYPADADAARGLSDAKKKAAEPKPAPMPMGKPPLYAKQMETGLALEKQGKYDQAIAAYRAALRLVPGDTEANNKVDFCQRMIDGAKALQLKKFADAVTAYESALKLFPNDQSAKQGLARAKTGK
jgi:superkiller protein 3